MTHRLTIAFLLGLPLLVCAAPAQPATRPAPDPRVKELAAKVAELSKEVEMLRAEVAQLRAFVRPQNSSAPQSPTRQPAVDLDAAAAAGEVKIGMTEDQADRAMGDRKPRKKLKNTFTGGEIITWIYDAPSGQISRIKFDNGKVDSISRD